MPRSYACFLLSLFACTGNESSSTRPAGEAGSAGQAHADAGAGASAGSEGPEFFLATLGQDGIQHCPGGGYEVSWLAVHPTLGFVNAGGPALSDPSILEPLYDHPVLAQGKVAEPPERPPLDVNIEMCMPMQMRSDWVSTPRGIRCMRNEGPRPDYFHATNLRRLDELSVTREGEELVVSFKNPLPVALEGVSLRMHYEGCYGKPGSTSKTSERSKSLAPGEAISHRFSLFDVIERDSSPGARDRSKHAAAELELNIEGASTSVHTDLSVSLRAFGIEFDCS